MNRPATDALPDPNPAHPFAPGARFAPAQTPKEYMQRKSKMLTTRKRRRKIWKLFALWFPDDARIANIFQPSTKRDDDQRAEAEWGGEAEGGEGATESGIDQEALEALKVDLAELDESADVKLDTEGRARLKRVWEAVFPKEARAVREFRAKQRASAGAAGSMEAGGARLLNNRGGEPSTDRDCFRVALPDASDPASVKRFQTDLDLLWQNVRADCLRVAEGVAAGAGGEILLFRAVFGASMARDV